MKAIAAQATSLGLIALLLAPAVWAASPTPNASPVPTPACSGAEFRQFDFWLGKWKVIGPKGKPVGTSEISRASEGCAIREQWTSAAGKGGMSINYYDPADQKWHQDWVGGDGTVLHLRGGMVGEAMILSGETQDAKGSSTMNRITWTPLPEGKVKQEWALSSDAGGTWKTIFVGIYEKAS